MYRFKEVTLKNKMKEKRILVIEFDKREMEIVAEFLMTDASLLNYEVLDLIKRVLAGSSKGERFSGNRISLRIKKDTTNLTDLFAGMYEGFDTYPAYEIDTVELKRLIEVWKNKSREY